MSNKQIREEIEYVVRNASHVAINDEKLEELAEKFQDGEIDHWLTVSPFPFTALSVDARLNFLFVLNSISFSYWGEPKWKVEYRGETYDGAQGMMAALGKAIEEDIPILDAQYLAHMNKRILGHVLRGNIEIPLLGNRALILRNLGRTTTSHFERTFSQIIDASGGDASRLVDIIINSFPSFQDSAKYKGRVVQFNKRAQLLAADVHYGINDKYTLKGVENLTACADYKLPQMFRRHGVFEYSPELQRKILGFEEIERGSEQEVEIRASTIKAVDLLTEKIRRKCPSVTVPQVNDYLWLQGQVKLPDDEPYHRTRTIAY